MKLLPYTTRQHAGIFVVVLIVAIVLIAAVMVMQKAGDVAIDHTKTSVGALDKAKEVSSIVEKRARATDQESEFQ